jgi:hypothetical protein
MRSGNIPSSLLKRITKANLLMSHSLHFKSLIEKNNHRLPRLGILLSPLVCFLALFLMSASASAASGPIPFGSTNIYPRSGGTYETSNAQTPLGSNLGFTGAANVVNEGGNSIGNINNGYYLWCPGGDYVVEKDDGGCSATQIKDHYTQIDERAFRPQGILGEESDYDVIVNDGFTNSVSVTLVGGCKVVDDNIGFEDHSYAPLSQGASSPESLITAVTTPTSGLQLTSGNNCNRGTGNDEIPIPPSAFQTNASLGTNFEVAVLQVYLYNSGTGQKVFGVETNSPGTYVGAADKSLDPGSKGLYTNLLDPEADNYYENNGNCHGTGSNDSNCPSQSTGGYSALSSGSPVSRDAGNNTPSNYDFYFSPDCSFSGSSLPLNWRDGQGQEIDGPSGEPLGEGGTQYGTGSNAEGWTLTDVTKSGENGPSMASANYNALGSGSQIVNGIVIGDTYKWEWALIVVVNLLILRL